MDKILYVVCKSGMPL